MKRSSGVFHAYKVRYELWGGMAWWCARIAVPTCLTQLVELFEDGAKGGDIAAAYMLEVLRQGF